MFTSSGYFKGLNCPYFQSGLCERPYCHFRHVKNEETPPPQDVAQKSYAEDLGIAPPITKAPSLLSKLGAAQRQIEMPTGPPVKRFMKYDFVQPNVGQAKYKPSPINKETGKVEVPVHHKRPSQTRTTIPCEYTPTPIHILKQRGAPAGNTRSAKPHEDYDPVSNYSSRVTLGDAGKGYVGTKRKTEAAQVLAEEQKRRRLQSQVEAKFSSDEDENAEEKMQVEQVVKLFPKTASCPDDVNTSEQKVGKAIEKKETDNGNYMKKVSEDGSNNLSHSETPVKNNTDTTSKESSSNGEHTHVCKCGGVKTEQPKDTEKGCSEDSTSKTSEGSVENIGNDFKKNNDFSNDVKHEQLRDVESKHEQSGSHKGKTHEENKSQHDKNKETENSSKSNVVSDSNKEHSKTNGKDSEKENDNFKKPHTPDKHRSSKHKKSSSHKTSDSKHKANSSSEKHKDSSKSHNSKTSSSRHRSNSKSEYKDKSSSSKISHRSSSKSSHRSSSTSSHSSSKSKPDTKPTSSSKHERSSSKNKHDKSKDSTKDSHSKQGKATNSENIFDIMLPCSFSKPKPKLEKVNSTNVELFGEDSDEDTKDFKQFLTSKPTKSESNKCIKIDSDSDDSDFIEISSVSSDDSVKDALRTGEDLDIDIPESDPYDECLSIFNEKRSTRIEPEFFKKREQEDEEDFTPTISVKKRIARVDDQQAERVSVKKKPPAMLAPSLPSPAEVMHNRFVEMQKRNEQAAKANVVSVKKRVAHLPTTSRQTSVNGRATVGSVPKLSGAPGKREAYVPKVLLKRPRPLIPKNFGTKIPCNVRQGNLDRVIDECLKIYPQEEDAYERALATENSVYEKSNTVSVYRNFVVIEIKKLRQEASDAKEGTSSSSSGLKSPTRQNPVSHNQVLGGKNAAQCTFTLNRSGGPRKEIKLTSGVLHEFLQKYVLTEQQLEENGFPRQAEGGRGAVIKKETAKGRRSNNPDEHVCIRCGKRFMVDTKTGQYERREECVYHWGKCWKRRVGRSLEEYWTCCSADANAMGCALGKAHVHEDNKLGNMSGYQQTIPCSPPPDNDYGTYALDCEMVYTTHGSELARITVVDHKLESVLDKLVKPANPIVDYNTRFSGLTKENFRGVRTSLQDVQAILLNMFSSNTILIGHSLESDLTALKMIHSCVVDTSVVFPHRLGPPMKRALRNLASEILEKLIQENEGGHDSHEDAAACMELMIHKVKQDTKVRRR